MPDFGYKQCMVFGIRELAERAKEIGAYDLAQGVIDHPPPPTLTEALRALPLEQYSTYNNKRGVLPYREAVVQYLRSRGWDADLKTVLGTAGLTGAMVAALLTERAPGDAVLLPEPFFIGHKLLLESLHFRLVPLPLPLDQEPDWDQLQEQMVEVGTLILTTPANPTGQVASPSILQALAKRAAATGSFLLIDEMYREFNWSEETPDDSAYGQMDLSRTVVLRGFSKTFSIPGWRAGFAVTVPERMEKMAAIHDSLYLGGSTVAQHALAAALNKNLSALNGYVSDLRTLLKSNMTVLAAAFRAYGMEPLPVPATYYMIIKHNRSSDAAAVEELLAKKIAVTPLNILYSDSSRDTGYIRIHFAVRPEVAQEVAKALVK